MATQVDIATNLIISKVRLIIVAFNVIPMLYFSIHMYLTYRSIKKPSLTKYKRQKIAKRTIITLVSFEIILILFSPTSEFTSILTPILGISSILVIVWTFFFAHRTKSLTDINPLIVAVGFSIYIITMIIRASLYVTQDAFTYAIYSEIMDIIVYFIIFLGLILKPFYLKKSEQK
ncbi:MAG: hypothetical protein GF383_07890 [Candidatus Lokiarchaeota archaeon]|nr:hypothetical protein [Candidatus Lokiarchaeota archaeon]